MMFRKYVIQTIIIILCSKFIISCANITAPTGGPKDEIPPKALSYSPANNSINFKSKIFYIKFNEKLKDIDDINQIIVNPKLEKPITVKIKNKKIVQVEINETLKDSTTYNFNFRNTIKDLTEGNTTEQIIQYSFSTGNYLDSNMVYGTTIDMFANKINENIVVGLYLFSDTLDITKHFPIYSSKVNKDGTYIIKNIKTGKYKIIAFEDKKNTLLYDNDEKIIEFASEKLIEGKIELNFKLSKINKGGINVLSGKNNNSQVYEINLSKGIKNAKITDKQNFRSTLSRNGKIITIYNLANRYNDSLNISLQLTDSLNVDSTLLYKVYYSDVKSKAKPVAPTVSVLKPANLQLTDIESNIEFIFKNPITKILTDSITIYYDSLHYIPNTELNFEWRNDSTILSLEIKNKIEDSLLIKFNKNSFIDIIGDTIRAAKFKLRKASTKSTAVISGTVSAPFDNAVLELLLDSKPIDTTTAIKSLNLNNCYLANTCYEY